MLRIQFSFDSQYFRKLILIFFEITIHSTSLYFSNKEEEISPDSEHRCPSLTMNYANPRTEKNYKHQEESSKIINSR